MLLVYETVSTVSTGPLRVLKSIAAPLWRILELIVRWRDGWYVLKEEGHHLADQRKFGLLKGRKSGGGESVVPV